MASPNVFQELFIRHYYPGDQEVISAYLDLLRRVSEEKLKGRALKLELAGRDNQEDILKLAHLGFMGIDVPEQYGGIGLGYTAYAMSEWEVGEFSGHPAIVLDTEISHVVQTIINAVGTEAQKERFLSRLAKGYVSRGLNQPETLGAEPNFDNPDLVIASFGQTEDEAGSHSKNITSRLEDMAGDPNNLKAFISKKFITNDARAGFTIFTVWYNGQITSVIVENDAPGHTITRIDTMGHKTSPTTERSMDGLIVPKENLIGRPGEGAINFHKALQEGRYGISIVSASSISYLIKEVVERANNRIQFKKPIINFDSVLSEIAYLEVTALASRLMVYQGALRIDRRETEDLAYHSALTKYFATERSVQAAKKAIEVFGAMGYSIETGIERFLRDAQLGVTGEGTSNVVREIAAKEMLRKCSIPTDSLDRRFEAAIYQGHEELKVYEAIKSSQEVANRSIRVLNPDSSDRYFVMLGDMAASIEATKSLFDFALTLREHNEAQAGKVLAMAMRQAVSMAEEVASNGNQFLLQNDKKPMYNAAGIYINNVLELEKRISGVHRKNLLH